MKCVECGKDVESTRECAHEIRGWELQRSQGGTNHVLWRETTGRLMCATCVMKKRLGISPDQMTLA
jgi:hypothetical protein